VDPTGLLLHVVNRFSSDVTTFRIDPARGALTPLGTVAAGDGPRRVVVLGIAE
jgi:6-phosphogluconolactonase (cycloisomerase 2 family)